MDAGANRHHQVADRRTRERRVWRTAFLASVVLHVVLFLTGPLGSIPVSPFAAAGPEEGDDRAAESSMEIVSLSSAPPDVAQPPPVPVVDVVLPDPEVVELDAAPEIDVDLLQPPEVGTGSSEGTDPEELADAGLPEAPGAGDAGTVEEGRQRVVPPSPTGIILPRTSPDLRGREVEVWVFVNEEGRVVADSTHLQPPTGNREYDEQLTRDASGWVFEPAREDGLPVAAWFPYTISM